MGFPGSARFFPCCESIGRDSIHHPQAMGVVSLLKRVANKASSLGISKIRISINIRML